MRAIASRKLQSPFLRRRIRLILSRLTLSAVTEAPDSRARTAAATVDVLPPWPLSFLPVAYEETTRRSCVGRGPEGRGMGDTLDRLSCWT